jgi:hypothetical protein
MGDRARHESSFAGQVENYPPPLNLLTGSFPARMYSCARAKQAWAIHVGSELFQRHVVGPLHLSYTTASAFRHRPAGFAIQ